MTAEVRVVMRKWPDSPHWEFDATLLGTDEYGTWVGLTRGTPLERPGVRQTAAADHVCLIPDDEWWLATFYGQDPERPFDTYVDITTPVEFDGRIFTAIDLDLDVVRGRSGRVFVDDEDEFAEHRVSLGYPEHVISFALTTTADIERDVRAAVPPFDEATSAGWLARFRSQL